MDDTNNAEGANLPSSKRLRPHVKVLLEQWYQSMGRPKMITNIQKDDILRKMQVDNSEPGITLWKLNNWLAQRRSDDRGPSSSKLQTISKRNPLSIVFPTLTKEELGYLGILTKETPEPSSELIHMWTESPVLPNVTVEVAQQFVKYNQLLLRDQHRSASASPSTSKQPPLHEDAEMDESSEEGDVLMDEQLEPFPIRPHLPTPTSTSPEPNRSFKPEPSEVNTTITTSSGILQDLSSSTHSETHWLSQDQMSSTVSIPKQSNLEDLVDSFRERTELITPARFVQLLETCQEKSEKFLAALQGGQLARFGFEPHDGLGSGVEMSSSEPQPDHATRATEPP